jgi:DNA-binding transcriptional LysR family regulator
MEIRHVRYFLAVAEELHFGRAAERLGMTQPPLSARIRDLERELGVRLFHRGGGEPVRLTAAGRALRPWAAEIVAGVDGARAAVRQAVGALAVGVAAGTPSRLLCRAIEGFGRRHPDIAVAVRQTVGGEELEALASGRVDVAVVRHVGSLDGISANGRPLLQTQIGVACRPDHPFAREQQVDAVALARNRVVCIAGAIAPQCRDGLVDFCRRHGVASEDVHEAVEPASLVRALCVASRRPAVALLPADDPSEALVWRPLKSQGLAMTTSVLVARTGVGACEPFVAALADAARGHLDGGECSSNGHSADTSTSLAR